MTLVEALVFPELFELFPIIEFMAATITLVKLGSVAKAFTVSTKEAGG